VLSKAHEQLEPTNERSAVRMCDYLQALCRSLTESMGVSVECDEAEFPVERAIPVGLIVNELVTNGSSTLSCRNEKVPFLSLCGAERTICSPLPITARECSKSATSGLGSQLVELLVRQLEGNLERTEATPGCRVQIEFPERA
jgi:two-component sensor histidine kinase